MVYQVILREKGPNAVRPEVITFHAKTLTEARKIGAKEMSKPYMWIYFVAISPNELFRKEYVSTMGYDPKLQKRKDNVLLKHTGEIRVNQKGELSWHPYYGGKYVLNKDGTLGKKLR